MKLQTIILTLIVGFSVSPQAFARTRVGVNSGSQYGVQFNAQETRSNGIREEQSQYQVGSSQTKSYQQLIEDPEGRGKTLIDTNITNSSFLDGNYSSKGTENTSSFVYRTGVSFEQEFDSYGGIAY